MMVVKKNNTPRYATNRLLQCHAFTDIIHIFRSKKEETEISVNFSDSKSDNLNIL